MSLSLQELLRRSDREELLPLARVLGISPFGMGRDKLARAIERALRLAGGHSLGNALLRRGDGPPYGAVLAGLARRMKVEVGEDEAATELALLAAWTGQPLRRKQLPVVKAGIAIVIARLAGMVLSPVLGPLAGLGLLLWLGRPRDEVLLPAMVEVARLRQRVADRITIGVVGPPSSGKDAAIRALFGIDTGQIHPAAGSTRTTRVYKLARDLRVVNTPGVGDVDETVSEQTRQILDQIDIFIFLVNAQGGVRTRERDEFNRVRKRTRPTLVVLNKVDTLREGDRARMVADTAEKLGGVEVVGAAFDPIEALAAAPIGVDRVKDWLNARLAELNRTRANAR